MYQFARDRWTSWAVKAVVAALGAVLVLSAQAGTATAEASDRSLDTNELIVRYEIGAPPTRWNGRPWGSQCVTGALARGMRVGRWIGAGMRIVRFDRVVPAKTAQKVAGQLERCPYVLWAEPNEKQLFFT